MRDVVNRHVVGALQKGGVNREERFQSLRGQPAGKKRGVFLGDADIEIAVGMCALTKCESPVPLGIAAGNGNELLIRIGEFRQRLAENLRIGRRRRRRGLAGLDLVFAETVEFVRLA